MTYRCPACGNQVSSPRRTLGATCAKTDKHPGRKTIAMVVVEDDE